MRVELLEKVVKITEETNKINTVYENSIRLTDIGKVYKWTVKQILKAARRGGNEVRIEGLSEEDKNLLAESFLQQGFIVWKNEYVLVVRWKSESENERNY